MRGLYADRFEDLGYMLVTFPENYRLYEHVKKTEKDGSTEIKAKTHAAGGNDRQDAYLYGHPAGRKKRFRSPADFFPHLLWLCTDESGDPDNCGCKICSPEDLETLIPGAKPLKVKTEPDSKINTAAATKIKQEPVMPSPIHRAGSASTPKQLVAGSLPQPKTTDQHIDQRYNVFTYRPGELVWFKRGQAWGLGAILRRWRTHSTQRHYSVQPLSQPYNHPQSVVKSSDDELRPWLAWSVPRYTIPGLNTLSTPPTYDTADWRGMASGEYGRGDVEVDASIMAAKRVDSSYTPFNANGSREVEAGVTETTYDGIYLGAEKCWVADPLRITHGDGTDVLVPRTIVEGRQRASNSSTIHLTGDIYTLQRTTHSNPSLPTPAAPNNNPNLPSRMTEDLAARNARSIPTRRSAAFWKLVKTNTRIELNDIKGRWYEASLVMPILNPDLYKQLHAQGQIEEMSRWMNSRGDCQRPANLPSGAAFHRQNVRHETRRDAFGDAMPAHAQVQDGIEPVADNIDPSLSSTMPPSLKMENTNSSAIDIDPRFETADYAHPSSADEIRVSRPDHSAQHVVDGSVGNFEDFMNLDGDDDGMEGVQQHSQMPGFGAEYASQGGGGYF